MFVVFEPNGTDFLVNSEVVGGQYDPKATGLSNGNYVITWIDFSGTLEDISLSSVKARIFDSAGTPVGGEFLVNTNTDSYQWQPTITALSNGGFIISWTDLSGTLDDLTGSSIKAQIYDAEGSRVGTEFRVNSETNGDQSDPAITGLTGGGFVVSWKDASATLGDASGTSIKAQIYNAAGARVGSEFLVNTEVTDDQLDPVITGLANGGFVISWKDASATSGDASGTSIKAQIYSSNGSRVGGEVLVNSQVTGDQSDPVVTSLANGGFVISWTDDSGAPADASGSSIKAQIYSAAGARVGAELLINTELAGNQTSPAITGLSSAGFVITWTDSSGTLGDASGTSIKMQVYEADGTLIGSEVLVNGETANAQGYPTVAATADGGFVVSWQDASGTLGDASGTSIKARMYMANTDVSPPVITSLGGGAVAGTFIAENSASVVTVTATSTNANTDLAYSISGGADSALFSIDATTGALAFKTAPDFEAPADAGLNNVYDVTVGVFDGNFTTSQAIAVTVYDVPEGPFRFAQPGPRVIANFNPANGWSSQNQNPRFAADVNGDGYGDVIGFGFSGVLVSYNSGQNTYANAALISSNFGQTAGWTNNSRFPREVVDLNGDGRADLIGFGQAGAWVSLARADGTFTDPAIGIANFGVDQGWTSQDGFARTLGDVNGDGFSDIIGFGAAGTLVSLGNGDGTFQAAKTAVANFGVAQGWNSDNTYHRELADVNGDGKDDIIGFGIAGTWVATADADGLFSPAQLVLNDFGANQGWSNNDSFPRLVADVNGDSFDDIVGFGIAGTLVSYAKVDGTFTAARLEALNFGANQGWNSDNIYHRAIADMNNDGLADIIGFGSAGVLVGLNDGTIIL